MTLDNYTAPECQLAGCDADAATTCNHPRFGDVQVCATCAGLFDGGETDE